MSNTHTPFKPALLAIILLGLAGCAQLPAGPEGSVGDRAASLQGAPGSGQISRKVFMNEEMAPSYAKSPAGPQGSIGDRVSSRQGAPGSNDSSKRVFTNEQMAP